VLLTIADRGLHKLNLSLGARRTRDGAIDFAVPPVTSATLIVPASPALEIPSALGATEQRAAQRFVSLGPASRIIIRSAAAPTTSMQAAQVQQQLWFRVRPNSVVLDAKWNVDVAQGRLDKITVLADPRLRLRPLANAQVVDGEPIVEQGDDQRIEFRLKPSAGSHFTLQASFHLTDSSGVGHVRLPRLQVLDLQTVRRQFAVSHAANVQLSDVQAVDCQPIPPEEFTQSWQNATDVPQFAYEIKPDGPPTDTRWTATSRFPTAATTADYQLTLRASADQLELELNALLTTSGGPVFQRRIAVPDGLRVTYVEVTNGKEVEQVRYAQGNNGRLTVFLPAPAGAQQRRSSRFARR
jgi:hypothetical protein